MRRLFLRPRSFQLLLAVSHFDHHLAGDVLRALAENLADLAHGLELLGFLGGFVAVGRADAALGILGCVLVRRFLGALGVRGLFLVARVALLIALRVALGLLLLALLALLARLVLLALLAVLRILLLLLLAVLR